MEDFRICKECNKLKAIEYFKHSEKYYRQVCRACNARWERIKLRLEIIGAYGAKCQCCGETNVMFLTLDHIYNDGNLERQTLACHQIYAKLRREGFPKENHQLLCFNCNMAKAIYSKCPHKI